MLGAFDDVVLKIKINIFNIPNFSNPILAANRFTAPSEIH